MESRQRHIADSFGVEHANFVVTQDARFVALSFNNPMRSNGNLGDVSSAVAAQQGLV